MSFTKAVYSWERPVSALGFPCSQWREKISSKSKWEALNFNVQLWTASGRNTRIIDPGEAHLLRARLVCGNSSSFSWLPITLCRGGCNRKRVWFYSRNPKGLVLFKEPQSDTGLKQHSHQGTQAQSLSVVTEWSQKLKQCTLNFLISQAGSVSSTFPAHM